MLLIFIIVSSVSFGQTGKSSNEKSVGHAKRHRKQMSHFETKKKDRNIKGNGTSYRKKRKKTYYNVDGDGFRLGPAMQIGR